MTAGQTCQSWKKAVPKTEHLTYGIKVSNEKIGDVVNMVDFGIPIGAGIAFGLGALGTGIAQSRIGAAGAGAVAEKPESFGLMLILVAIPETLVILGFVVAAMIMLMLE
jgi:V/A-type H+-transporting ATPase subunit K